MTQSDYKTIERVVELYFEGKTLKEAIRQAKKENIKGEDKL